MNERAIDRTIVPEGDPWTFDKAVATVFDDMLRRSIPDYAGMRDIVFRYGSRLVSEGSVVVDYGCSLGAGLAPFVDRFGAHNRFVALDNAPAMLAVVRQRFAGMVASGIVDVVEADLATYFPPKPISLTLSIFSLQFVPLEDRFAVLSRIRDATLPAGGLVIAEKVVGSDAYMQAALVAEYHALKSRNGYSTDEIVSKARALRGVLVPLSVAENERALRAAGFAHVEMVWRSHNFAAWMAVR